MAKKYGPGASKAVARAMRALKRGRLASGRRRRPVRDPEQAIAIGLDRARREGARVPPRPRRRTHRRR